MNFSSEYSPVITPEALAGVMLDSWKRRTRLRLATYYMESCSELLALFIPWNLHEKERESLFHEVSHTLWPTSAFRRTMGQPLPCKCQTNDRLWHCFAWESSRAIWTVRVTEQTQGQLVTPRVVRLWESWFYVSRHGIILRCKTARWQLASINYLTSIVKSASRLLANTCENVCFPLIDNKCVSCKIEVHSWRYIERGV